MYIPTCLSVVSQGFWFSLAEIVYKVGAILKNLQMIANMK